MTAVRVCICALVMVFTITAANNFDQCFSTSDVPTGDAARSFNFTGVDAFGLRLLQELYASNGGNGNLVMSPYSIWSALSLAYFGAQGNTKTQLEDTLGLPTLKREAYRTKFALNFVMRMRTSGAQGSPEMRSVDKAYFDKTLSLRDCVDRVLHDVSIIDFTNTQEATRRINGDVRNATANEIQNFLDPSVLTNAVFVLLNAVYFNGTWETEFNKMNTKVESFYRSPGRQNAKTVDMMHQQGRFNIVSSPAMGAAILELPYRNSNICMLVILPDDENASVGDLLQTLNPYTLRQALAAARKLPVKVTLPKFEMESRVDSALLEALSKMGITDMFSVAQSDFRDFTTEPIFVNKAIHQAKVRVDEKGTVASAVTVAIGTRSGPSQFFDFTADRPFVFAIYEKQVQITLFAGVVTDP